MSELNGVFGAVLRIPVRKPAAPWPERRWQDLDRDTCRQALRASSDEAAWQVIIRRARAVLRTYSTSFFIVTRFLPPPKRAKVEAIYAAVRYPDEVVDSFPLDKREKLRLLDQWAAQYEEGLKIASVRDALRSGIPGFVTGFTQVLRDDGISPEHYRAFLAAMRRDACPERFETLSDLIDSYVYGSAVVVGYFLTHVYGSSSRANFDRALESARSLGIALQLTNFLRDVNEDQRRGRLYLPLDMLRAEGISEVNVNDPTQHPALNRVVKRMAGIAEGHYARSAANLDAFSSDCRTAIRACIDVYRQLNERVSRRRGMLRRESVPLGDKFRVLPASKYWVLPMAYLRD